MGRYPAGPTSEGAGGRDSVPELSAGALHVLLVEDEDVPAEMYRYRFLLEGFVVSRAKDGAQAIALAGAARPDIILLDPHLSDLDGLEVLRRLKAEDATRDLPVIVLDRQDDERARRRSLDLGAQEWVPRSEVGPGELSRMVRLCLFNRLTDARPATTDGRRRRRAAPRRPAEEPPRRP